MSDNNVSQDTLKKIKNKDIKPKPRWHFLLKDYVVWIFGFISLLVGSLSFSVVLYMLVNNDWDIYSNISNSLWQFILTPLPYFWLLFLLIFIGVAYYNFRHTKGGYKIAVHKLIAGSIIFSILFGSFLYKIGVAQTMDGLVIGNEYFYKKVINRRAGAWSQPDKGLLAGVLIYVEDEEHVTVKGLDGELWQVDVTEAELPLLPVEISMPLKIIGEVQGDNIFKAKAIFPMKGMRFMKDKGGPHSMLDIKRPLER